MYYGRKISWNVYLGFNKVLLRKYCEIKMVDGQAGIWRFVRIQSSYLFIPGLPVLTYQVC